MAGEWSESDRLVLISVVPHCTQPWVTSSRSFDSAPSLSRAGATDVTAIRWPQCGQGMRKLCRCDGATPLQRMELSRSKTSRFHCGYSPTRLGSSQQIFVRCTNFVRRNMTSASLCGRGSILAQLAQSALLLASRFVAAPESNQGVGCLCGPDLGCSGDLGYFRQAASQI
jgi:hypothetical protein